jgi:adenosylcobinamide kinase / adenosylcobinamide-phosphate guanylyltransferase
MKTLILGGVRSGKSRHAEGLARARGGRVTIIATGTAQDAEMAARIEAHRRNRPAEWRVIEEPIRLAAALEAAAIATDTVIVDCLTLWLTNLLCSDDPGALGRETGRLLEVLPGIRGECIFVSNEVGFGIMPMNALARRFGDEAGLLHQRVAALCDRVVIMVAGIARCVKHESEADHGRAPGSR